MVRQVPNQDLCKVEIPGDGRCVFRPDPERNKGSHVPENRLLNFLSDLAPILMSDPAQGGPPYLGVPKEYALRAERPYRTRTRKERMCSCRKAEGCVAE